MNTYQVKSEPNKLYFKNLDRIDESVLFENAYDIMKSNDAFSLGSKSETPLEIIQECKFKGTPLELVNDISYGTYILSAKADITEELISLFND